MLRKVFLFCVIVVTGIFTSCALSQSAKKAPDFSIVDLQGKQISLSSLKGKVVVLNFWASWCPSCKAEIPDFVKTYEKYRDEGLIIIGIAVNSKPDDVRELVKKYNITYFVAMDDGRVEKAYGPIPFVPTTFIIDKEGNLIPGGKKIGMFKEGELEKVVEPLLK